MANLVNSTNGFFGASGGGTSPPCDTTLSTPQPASVGVVVVASNSPPALAKLSDSAGNAWTGPFAAVGGAVAIFVTSGNFKSSASHTFTYVGATETISFVAMALGGVQWVDKTGTGGNGTSVTSVQPALITPQNGTYAVISACVAISATPAGFFVASPMGFTILGQTNFSAGVHYGLGVALGIPPNPSITTSQPTWSFGGGGPNAAQCYATQLDLLFQTDTIPLVNPGFMNLVTRPAGPASSGYGYAPLMFGNVFPPVILYSITGNVQQPGTTVFFTGPVSGSAIAGAGGNYVIPSLIPGNYIITPSLVGYSFAPTSQAVTVSTFNVTNINFTATYTGAIFSISGNAGAAGVTVSWTGTSSGSVSADGSGNYTIPNLTTGTYTVTPSSGLYTFTPPSQTVNVISSNLTGINFIATPVLVGHSISGNIGVAYGTVGWVGPGGTHGGVTADAFGNYIIVGLGDGSYTLKPRLTGWSFTPVTRTVVVSGANVTGVNWTALNLFQLPVTRDATAAPASGQIVPLSVSPNQTFTVNLTVDGNALTLNLGLRFSTMAGYWVLSIYDANNNIILDSLPMITGWYPAGNILAQYSYLKIGSAFILNEGTSNSDYPGSSDLGTGFQLLWADTA